MSEMPWYILSGTLVLLLVLQALHNQKIQKGLIDKILEKQGLEPIPDDSPIGSMLKEMGATPINEEQVKTVKKAQEAARIRFNIPNMPKPPQGY